VSIVRINRGRSHSYLIDGHKADSVTGLLGDGWPKPALINWAADVTASFAVDRWDELGELSVSKRLEQLKKARWNENEQAKIRGTKLHKLGEQLVQHEEVEIPEGLEGHAESYVRFLDTWHPTAKYVEALVANRKIGYCGTFDLLCYLPDLDETWLMDIKTGRSGIWPETAMQMAAYRHAEVLVAENRGPEIPMPQIDRTAAIHVRADGFDVIPVETGPDVFTAFRHVAWVARCLREESQAWIGEALEVPAA
jgi:hypothetical protein